MQTVLLHENIVSVNNLPEHMYWQLPWRLGRSSTWHFSEHRSGHKRLVDKLVVDLQMVARGC